MKIVKVILIAPPPKPFRGIPQRKLNSCTETLSMHMFEQKMSRTQLTQNFSICGHDAIAAELDDSHVSVPTGPNSMSGCTKLVQGLVCGWPMRGAVIQYSNELLLDFQYSKLFDTPQAHSCTRCRVQGHCRVKASLM